MLSGRTKTAPVIHNCRADHYYHRTKLHSGCFANLLGEKADLTLFWRQFQTIHTHTEHRVSVVPDKAMDTAKLVETPSYVQNRVRDTDNGAAIHLHRCRHQLDRYQFSEHFASVRIVSSSLSPPAPALCSGLQYYLLHNKQSLLSLTMNAKAMATNSETHEIFVRCQRICGEFEISNTICAIWECPK